MDTKLSQRNHVGSEGVTAKTGGGISRNTVHRWTVKRPIHSICYAVDCLCSVVCLCAECRGTGQRDTVGKPTAAARWCHAKIRSHLLTACCSATGRGTYTLWRTWLRSAKEKPQSTTVGLLRRMRSLAAFCLCRHRKKTTWCVRVLNLSGAVRLDAV